MGQNGTLRGPNDEFEVIERFVSDALALGLIDGPTGLRLQDEVNARRQAAHAREAASSAEPAVPAPLMAPPATVVPPRPDPPVVPAPSAPVSRGAKVPGPPAAPSPAGPSWFERVRALVASDFALHGLSYLGVLLTFAGTFGFVLFAFGQVSRDLRPVAEVAIPIVVFGSGWFVRRRRAPSVASGLELLGAAILPVVAFASLIDGAPVPPDPTNGALVAALTLTSLVLSATYAIWAARHPGSPLRFFVGPLAWTGLLALGLVFRTGPIVGRQIEHIGPSQTALATVGVAATLVALVRAPGELARTVRVSAIPALAVAYLLTVLLAAGQGWPSTPLLAAGVAVLVGLEFAPQVAIAGWQLNQFVAPAQAVFAAVTLAALTPELGQAWVGVTAVAVSIAGYEWEERRRPSLPARLLFAAGGAVGLGFSFADPWPAVASWSAATTWIHFRRIADSRRREGASEQSANQERDVLPGSPDVQRLVLVGAASLVPLGLLASLVRALPGGPGYFVASSFIVCAAVLLRLRGGEDRFWRSWVAAVGGLMSFGIGAASLVGSTGLWWLAGSAGLDTVAIAIMVEPAVLRAWAGSAAFAVAAGVAFQAAGLPARFRAPAWSLLGLAALATAVGEAALRASRSGQRRTPVLTHLAPIGILVLSGALVSGLTIATTELAKVTDWASWTTAWFVLAWMGDADPLSRAVRDWPWSGPLRRSVRLAESVALVVGILFTALYAARLWPSFRAHPSWAGLLLAGIALAYALAGRLVRARKPLAPVLAGAAMVVSLAGIGLASPDEWPAIGSIAAAIAVAPVMGRSLRRSAMTWVAWGLSVPMVLLLANEAGVDPSNLHLVALGWGAILLVGGLAIDDVLAGRRQPEQWLRTSWVVPPMSLGALMVPVGLGLTLRADPSVFGWWLLAGSALFAVVAVQTRVGAVSLVAYGLGSGALAALVPSSRAENPWILVVLASILVVASWVSALILRPVRRSHTSAWWLRWDLPPLVVAHVVAVAALYESSAAHRLTPTWVATGTLALAQAVAWTRATKGRATALDALATVGWILVGTALTLVGAAAAGSAWLAIGLAATSGAAAAAVGRAPDRFRPALLLLAAGTAGGSWDQALVALAPPHDAVVVGTALAAGAVALAGAGAARAGWLRRDAALTWMGLGVAGVLGAVAATDAGAAWLAGRPVPIGPADRLSALLGLAGGFALLAVSAGISARPWGRPVLRHAASILALVAGGLALTASAGLSLQARVAIVSSAGFIGVVGSLILYRRDDASPWLGPLAIAAAIASVTAVPLAASGWPQRSLLVAAMAVTGAESAAVGLTLRRTEPLYAAPALLCAAWILFASESLTGNPQWFTVPIGISVLAVVELGRWTRRLAGPRPPTRELIALEAVGIAFFVSAALIQTAVRGLAYGFPAIGLGIAVAAWAGLTRVRRRALAAAGVILLAVLLMLAAPLARLVPAFHGIGLWIGLATVGTACILAATLLEKGRATAQAAAKRLGELMKGWE